MTVYIGHYVKLALCVFFPLVAMKMVSRRKLQHYKKHYCTTFVTGLFGCRWHRYKQVTKDTGKTDLVWYMWLIICTLFTAFVLYYWILAGNDYDDFGWYLYDNTGKLWPLYTILLSLTCILVVYVALLFLLSLAHIGMGHELYMHWVHRVVLILSMLCAILILALMTEFYNHGWTLQVISLMITGPFLHLSAVVVLTSLAWFIAAYWYTLHKLYIKAVYLTGFAVIMILLYVSPVFIDSPCVCQTKDLPTRPKMMTHRGASALVPENTLEAFKKAAKYDHVLGFESDVTVSYDGVAFLMHDKTLIRTTDVEEKFPSRKDDCACSFNISEIHSLDAGRWFLEKDPHRTLSQISDSEKETFKHIKIPTLSELLEIMKKHKKKFLFDIQTYEYGMPKSHPYYNRIGDVIIETIINSSVNQKDVLWLYEGVLNTTIEHSFTLIKGKLEGPDELLEYEDVKINVPYYSATYPYVRSYHDANISVNVWVVNSKWLYSLYWCMGVHSVTTNFVNTLSQMSSPVWHLTPSEFEAMWVVVDFISAAVIIIIFVVQRIRIGGATKFRQEISIQNARQHISQKQHHKKYMKEKLIGSAEGIYEREHTNPAIDHFDTQSIDSSVPMDTSIEHNSVKLENLVSNRQHSSLRNSNGTEAAVETSLENITIHVPDSKHRFRTKNSDDFDFEHEFPGENSPSQTPPIINDASQSDRVFNGEETNATQDKVIMV